MEVALVDVNNQTHTATTDADGAFAFADLPPGPVRVHVNHPGHALLPLGATASVDALLSVAQVAETVLVEGVSPSYFDVIGAEVNTAAMLDHTGLALSVAAFRSLSPVLRKRFKKHTAPITYIRTEDPHRLRWNKR